MLVESRDLGDGVRILRLNRPPANAINAEFLGALGAQCKAARDDENVRAVIVAGNGKFFSGGLDLKETASGANRVGNLAGSQDDGLFMLWTLPKPTVAMVNGHAIAGGVIIALACDFRIAQSGNHRFGLNEVAIGLAFRGAPSKSHGSHSVIKSFDGQCSKQDYSMLAAPGRWESSTRSSNRHGWSPALSKSQSVWAPMGGLHMSIPSIESRQRQSPAC
jgi:Enoyl-CoA hydratase/isomerase